MIKPKISHCSESWAQDIRLVPVSIDDNRDLTCCLPCAESESENICVKICEAAVCRQALRYHWSTYIGGPVVCQQVRRGQMFFHVLQWLPVVFKNSLFPVMEDLGAELWH